MVFELFFYCVTVQPKNLSCFPPRFLAAFCTPPNLWAFQCKTEWHSLVYVLLILAISSTPEGSKWSSVVIYTYCMTLRSWHRVFFLSEQASGGVVKPRGIGAGEMGKHGQKKPPARQTSSVLEKLRCYLVNLEKQSKATCAINSSWLVRSLDKTL